VLRTVALVEAPWDAQPLSADEPEFRQTTFNALGLMSFHVDEQDKLIQIFDVTWVG
jgi:hypothetical protein